MSQDAFNQARFLSPCPTEPTLLAAMVDPCSRSAICFFLLHAIDPVDGRNARKGADCSEHSFAVMAMVTLTEAARDTRNGAATSHKRRTAPACSDESRHIACCLSDEKAIAPSFKRWNSFRLCERILCIHMER